VKHEGRRRHRRLSRLAPSLSLGRVSATDRRSWEWPSGGEGHLESGPHWSCMWQSCKIPDRAQGVLWSVCKLHYLRT
jgi:hypothetical protein